MLPLSAEAAAPSFTDGPAFSSDTGHFLLSWESDGPVTLSMAQAPDLTEAKPLYSGTQTSYFISGLSDGEYHLTLASADGEMSDPAVLTVAHQSLSQALWLTLIGLVITVAIIVTIMKGARDD